MVVLKELVLPTVEELTVQEVKVDLPTLMAASFHLGKACETVNNVSVKLSSTSLLV